MKRTGPLRCCFLLASLALSIAIVSAQTKNASSTLAPGNARAPLVTFVELGSVNCIPCRQMQPVMKAIENKYGDQVKILFYDVWKSDQRHYSSVYRIRVIPTQVFLDAEGKEFHRHEGFYPEEAIDLILQGRGLKPRGAK